MLRETQTRRDSERLIRTLLNLRRTLALLLVGGITGLFVACGGQAINSAPAVSGTLAGNWQFSFSPPTDNSFSGGLLGGFLLQKQGSVTGQTNYQISLPGQSGGSPTVCNSGAATVTGTLQGQSVSLTAAAGTQTFSLTGNLSSDGSSMTGTYNSTDGQGCGTAQSGLAWTAKSVPPFSGSIEGNLHSVLSPTLRDQDFPVSGNIVQGPNIGASSATITGALFFESYPCLASASVTGQISGNTVILQIFAPNGLDVGQIGAPAGLSNPSPVTFSSSAGGMVLQGSNGYAVSTKSCPGGTLAGDIGNVCLALGGSTACTQPIFLTPASIVFPLQQVGSAATTQMITLSNNDPSGSTVNGLSLTFNPQTGSTSLFGLSDFDGLANFAEQDNCSSSPGATFSLAPQQSCTITISFAPQQGCPWLPSAALGGASPSSCPVPLAASVTINSSLSADSDKTFAVRISGSGFSALVPSTPELDFGAEALTETSAPQTLTFTNQGASPVQILPALPAPCVNPTSGTHTLNRPLVSGSIAGLQVDTGAITPNGSTINYYCDSDPTSKLPNFQISADTCSGQMLAPQANCTLQIAFAPQPVTPLVPALDYFLELNTLQCTSTTTANCEIDSGRFPVELTANVPSPLRMTPGAGLDFGIQAKGIATAPLSITLFNDPKDPNSATINFTGNLVKGDYSETDNCGASLAPGSSCTMNITFVPQKVGFDPGTITITYNPGQTQIVHLRGTGQ